uniref:Secreted protein n=1 Tax=Anguilla anguilla TaxID=7936 RepID=A0A0E9RYE4_ANGAN
MLSTWFSRSYQRPRLGLQCLSIFLQTLGLFAQLGHCAVEGLELGGDVSHLSLCLVHVLLQAVAQLQETVGDHVHVVPGGVPPILLLP